MNLKFKIKKYIIFLNGKNTKSNVRVYCLGVSSNNKQLSEKNEKINKLYAADGALNKVLKQKLMFNKLTWAGDFDSINSTAKKIVTSEHSSVTKLIAQPDKNFSDFSMLLDKIQDEAQNHSVFLEVFYGLGGRKDHEVANIQEVYRFISQLPFGGLCYFHSGVVISSLSFMLSNMKNKRFSVFNLNEKSKSFEIEGAKYSGKICLTRPSHGISNIGRDDFVSFKLPPQIQPVYVYF